ncbi:MAG: hypothetical protein U0992_21865 [Planctomycetaceae bacterium]
MKALIKSRWTPSLVVLVIGLAFSLRPADSPHLVADETSATTPEAAERLRRPTRNTSARRR